MNINGTTKAGNKILECLQDISQGDRNYYSPTITKVEELKEMAMQMVELCDVILSDNISASSNRCTNLTEASIISGKLDSFVSEVLESPNFYSKSLDRLCAIYKDCNAVSDKIYEIVEPRYPNVLPAKLEPISTKHSNNSEMMAMLKDMQEKIICLMGGNSVVGTGNQETKKSPSKQKYEAHKGKSAEDVTSDVRIVNEYTSDKATGIGGDPLLIEGDVKSLENLPRGEDNDDSSMVTPKTVESSKHVEADISKVPKFKSKVSNKYAFKVYTEAFKELSEIDSGYVNVDKCGKLLSRWFERRFLETPPKHYNLKCMPRWILAIVVSFSHSCDTDKVNNYINNFDKWLDQIDTNDQYVLPYQTYNYLKDCASSDVTKTVLVLFKALQKYGISKIFSSDDEIYFPSLLRFVYFDWMRKKNSKISVPWGQDVSEKDIINCNLG